MKALTLEEIKESLLAKKQFFYEAFGVTKIGIFGSFAQKENTSSSDIDIVIEMEEGKKTLHNFLQFKRLLEDEFKRPVDLGFEHTLKPIVREKLKDRITYV